MNENQSESPIDEIHRIRREISDRFRGDVAAIAEDAARRQAASGRPVWKGSPAAIPIRPSESGSLRTGESPAPAG